MMVEEESLRKELENCAIGWIRGLSGKNSDFKVPGRTRAGMVSDPSLKIKT